MRTSNYKNFKKIKSENYIYIFYFADVCWGGATEFFVCQGILRFSMNKPIVWHQDFSWSLWFSSRVYSVILTCVCRAESYHLNRLPQWKCEPRIVPVLPVTFISMVIIVYLNPKTTHFSSRPHGFGYHLGAADDRFW